MAIQKVAASTLLPMHADEIWSCRERRVRYSRGLGRAQYSGRHHYEPIKGWPSDVSSLLTFFVVGKMHKIHIIALQYISLFP